MRLLWNYLKNYKWVLLGTLVLTAINQIFSLLDPLIFQRIVDRYVSRIDTLTRAEFVSGVGGLLLLGVGIVFVSRVAKNFQDYFLNSITQKLGTKMYADSVSHSFRLPYAVFEDQRSGEFLSKLQSARNDAQQLLQLAISTMFFSIIGVVFVLVYAFITSWIVGLAYLLLMPTLGFAAFYISRGIQKAQTAIVKETQALAGSTTETLRNVELVKSLGLENQEIGRLNTVNDQILALELKKVRMVRTLDFIQGTLINALRTGLTFLMLYLIFTKDITLGQYFSLLIFSFYIFTPLGQLGAVATKYYETKASMAKLQEILAMPVEPQPTDAVKIDDVKDIVFKDLSFGYQSAGGTAVQDISFTITSGETIALAGPSGSGKTTLIKLLVGLYKPTGGQLLYNSTDSQHIDWESFRKNIGLVSQDTQLFAGTIRENLLFAAPSATDAECMEALHAASATTIISRGDKGLDTKIGESGLKLSGGEKQRLAIARALLRKPNVIIFDEATSSLDSLTEEDITQTIKEITKNRPHLITILVAHRLSTIVHADRIMVLEKGRVAESGSHKELLEQKGLYAALWRQQIASGEVATA